MSHAMNDEEVNTELKKMVEFIRQEAQEKAREIQVKADEEFAIEKVGERSRATADRQAKIVQQESSNLDAQFEKKKKQVETQQKMCVPPLTQCQVQPEQQGASRGAQAP